MTVSSLAPRARRRMEPPAPPHPVTQYALDVVAGRIIVGTYVRKAAERHLADLSAGQARGIWFDEAAATKAISFFGLLRHYKGDLGKADGGRGAFVVLEAWQRFAIGAAFGWKRDTGLRRFRKVYLEVAKKNGKALALDTPIPTTSGWTTMGELREGDALFGEHGQPCRVTFATPIMRDHDCYRVEFSDGTAVVADAEHRWLTEELRHGYRASIKTTAEIAASITTRRDGASNHRIPVAGALVLPDADLTVDPYVLGVWLGDGDTGQAIITVADQDAELLQHVAAAGVAVHARPVRDRTPRYRLGSTGALYSRSAVATALRGMGLIGNKHIPAAYLRGSVEQRLALLQGLMDTDGHVTPRGQCEFTTTRPQLRDGFLELARSLGYKPTAREGVATIAGREIGPKWRIQFHGRRDRAPFRLARKLLRVSSSVRDSRSTRRQITAAVPIPSVPVRCIQVDSPSHLFLAGEAMVPTHNTLTGAGVALLLTFFDGEPGAEFYSLATKEAQAKLSWNDGAQFVKKNASLKRRIRQIGKRLVNEQTASFWMALGRDSDVGDQGINAIGGLVDELHVLDSREPIDNLETATSSRSQPQIWEITTAGVKRESVWAEERADAIAILEGRATDDSVLALVYTLDMEPRQTSVTSSAALRWMIQSCTCRSRDTASIRPSAASTPTADPSASAYATLAIDGLSGSETQRSAGKRTSTRVDGLMPIGNRSAPLSADGRPDTRDGRSNATASLSSGSRQPNTIALSSSRIHGVGSAEFDRTVSALTTITTLGQFEDFCASSATARLASSELVRRVYSEHSPTCAVGRAPLRDNGLEVILPGDDPFDEAVWPKANPNLGVSVNVETLRIQAEQAKRSPGKLAAYLRFRMNVPTSVSTRALDIDEWDACSGLLAGEDCHDWEARVFGVQRVGFGGLDLASIQDLTALLFVAQAEDGAYEVLCRFYCPEDGIEQRSKRDGVPYGDWVRDGYLVATPGNVTDYDFVEADILALADKHVVSEVGFDRWNATQLATDLGAEGAAMVAIPQTHAGLAPAWREIDKAIIERKLRHGGHPILRWMAGNVEVETDAAGNQKPSKRLSTERIDGMVALDMAIARWMANGGVGVWTAA